MAPLTLEVPGLDAAAEVLKAREAPSSQAMITLPSSPPAPPAPVSSDPSAILDQAANQAKAARDAALGDAAAAKARCKELEVELQGLRDELAKEVRI